jgi:diguanylate cyclase (GGDEF)-like protein
MGTVAYIVEIDIISILVLLMVHYDNRQMALMHRSFHAFQRLVEFSMLFCVLNTVGRLIPPANIPAIRIINCLKIVSCISMGCSWFLTIFHAVSGTSSNQKKWLTLIIIPSVLVSVFAVVETLTNLSNGSTEIYPLVWVFLNILSILYIVAAGILSATNALKTKNRLHRRILYIHSFAMLLPLFSLVVQAKYMEMPITSPAFVIVILFLHFQGMSQRISVDTITGLNNTNKLSLYLERITQSQNPAKRLFFVDIEVDHFKTMVKKLGKESGIITLRKMAAFLRQQCSSRGIFLARYGKNSFAVVCECNDYSEIEAFTNKLTKESKDNSELTQGPWPITFSIYCAEFGTPETKTIDAMLDHSRTNCIKPPTPLA